MLKNSCTLLFLIFLPFYCISGGMKNIKNCKLDSGIEVKLISMQTDDGSIPYLMFDNIIASAFLDGSILAGDVVLAKCINHSLIFALNYGPPYMKGCLITDLIDDGKKKNHHPKGVCFAERNTPESIWFSEKHSLIIIKNDKNTGEWNGKYIVYDSREKEAQSFNHLPDKKNIKFID